MADPGIELPNGFELVLSRYQEDVSWLRQVPSTWEVTVYNKGQDDVPSWTERHVRTANLSPHPHGREAYTFAHHIAERYDTLASYTAFSQGDPFDHSPRYIELLRQPRALAAVQTMSVRYDEQLPPPAMLPNALYRSSTISLRTMDSVFYHDPRSVDMANLYREHYNLTVGTNLIAHLFARLGLTEHVPSTQLTGNYAFGAQFGASRERLRQHPRAVYVQLRDILAEQHNNAHIVERAWEMLLGGATFGDAASALGT